MRLLSFLILLSLVVRLSRYGWLFTECTGEGLFLAGEPSIRSDVNTACFIGSELVVEGWLDSGVYVYDDGVIY